MQMTYRDVFLYVMALAIVGGGVFGLADALMSPGSASADDGGESVSVTDWFGNPLAHRERLNVLLIGADQRVLPTGEVDRGRSDTLILLTINPKLKRAAMLSIPRDLLVTIPEARHSYPQKINAAYLIGEVPLTVRTVEREMGMRVDYHAKVDLDDFVEVVDMLGGVWLEVPDIEGGGRGMNYDDNWGNLRIRLKPGYQHLDGEQAMGFVRYRKSMYSRRGGGYYGISDIQRGQHQQQFLQAMVDQKLKLRNLPQLLRAGSYIMERLDTDMDWRTAVGLIKVLRGVDSGDIMQLTLPVFDRQINGIYYCDVGKSALRELQDRVDAFLAGALDLETPEGAAGEGEKAEPEKARPLRVRVLNGCGKPGAGRRAAEMLRGPEYHVGTPGNARSFDYERTVIEYRSEQREAARALARKLGVARAELKESGEAEGPDLIVILGKDFRPPA